MKKNRKFASCVWKRILGMVMAGVMTVSMIPAMPALSVSAADSDPAMQYPSDMLKAGSIPATENTITEGQPFAPGTAGSQNFRIPALLALENGDLVAAADARYGTLGDGGGLDTIASVSSDGGKTWSYSFPIFFPDSKGFDGAKATTIIDPILVEGEDGVVYCLADVNPTGSTTYFGNVPEGTGYVTVEGKRYLAITDNYSNVTKKPQDDNLTDYPYYVAEFDEQGYAPILKRENNDPTGFGIDRWYNLYTIENGQYIDNLRQNQTNDATVQIQQNVFYEGSQYHVYKIGYIWMVASEDHGRTWGDPVDLTDQVKRTAQTDATKNDHAILVSPGKGIVTREGDLLLGLYDNGSTDNREDASFMYSSDNGVNWARTNDIGDILIDDKGNKLNVWSSENEMVELKDGTIRMFYRNGRGVICYADAKKGNGAYQFYRDAATQVSVTSTCNVTAIKYSKEINGKEAILVACPSAGSSRSKGKIFTFLVEDDGSLTLFADFAVPTTAGGYNNTSDGYCYSCMSETKDGDIALLWETNNPLIILFDRFKIQDIAPGARIEGAEVKLNLKEGEAWTYTKEGKAVIAKSPDGKTAAVKMSEDAEGKQTTVSITGVKEGVTSAVVDGVMYQICVSKDLKLLPLNETYTVKGAEEITAAPKDESILKAELVDRDRIGLFNHVADKSSSMESFSDTENTKINIEDAEFTFTGSGDTWQIYSEKKGVYLTNKDIGHFFNASGEDDDGQDMKVTATEGQGTFRICKAKGQRYVIFHAPKMDFNANTNYNASADSAPAYELVLLEKQETVSDEDVLPGYRRVSSITSGKKYLISYIWEDDSVVVLYPENGEANMTKGTEVIPNKDVEITAVGKGKAEVIVDGRIYSFNVVEPGFVCSHNGGTRIVGKTDPGCDIAGYTGDTVCNDCGEVVTSGESVPAIGHDWGEGKVTKEVTREKDGEKTYYCKHDPVHTRIETIYASAYAPLLDEYERALDLLDNSGLYTEETIKELRKVFDEYKDNVEGKDGARSELLKGAEFMAVASAGLSKKTAGEIKEDISSTLDNVEGMKALGQGGYSKEAWDNFLAAYEKAQSAGSGTETDPDALWKDLKPLQAAIAALNKEKAEIDDAAQKLSKVVSDYTGTYQTGKGNYQEPGWSAFVKAYEDAKNPPANANMEMLKGLLSKLEAAKKALKAVVPAPDPQPGQDVLKKGDAVTVKNVQYKVLDPAKKTAAAFKGSKNTLAKVTIQATVNIKGVTCTVTEISTNAFKGYKKLTNVTIGKNVKTIGKNAFNGCKKLKKVTFKGTAVKKIKSGAYKKTGAKMTVKVPKKMTKKQRATLLKKLKKAGASKKAKLQ